jgi:hypothetical protein
MGRNCQLKYTASVAVETQAIKLKSQGKEPEKSVDFFFLTFIAKTSIFLPSLIKYHKTIVSLCSGGDTGN